MVSFSEREELRRAIERFQELTAPAKLKELLEYVIDLESQVKLVQPKSIVSYPEEEPDEHVRLSQ